MASTLALFALICTTTANRPHVSLNIKDGTFSNIGDLDPSLSWSSSCKSGDTDLEYGIEAAVFPTSNISSLPRIIWGKVSTNVSGWGVTARGECIGTDFMNANIDVDAFNSDLSLHLEASTGNGFNVHQVEATKNFEKDGSCITVNPRYNVDTDKADVILAYSNGVTDIEVTASQGEQSVTLSHELDDDNRLAPTFASNGNISLEWEHRLSDENSVTTTLKPKKCVDVEWRDSSWTANINLPIDGSNIKGTNVRIKREVKF